MKLGSFFRLLSEVLRNKFWRPASGRKPFVYVALGDSTTEGIGASDSSKSFPALVYVALKKELPFVEYHNLGKKSAQVKDVIEKQLSAAVERKPDLVTISVGANDAMKKIGTKNFLLHFRVLLKSLTEQTDAIIVVNNIPDFVLTTLPVPLVVKNLANLKAKKINKILEEEAKAMGAVFVDIHAQSKMFRNYKDLISADGLHPSDLGHAIWGAAIVSALRPVILTKYKITRGI